MADRLTIDITGADFIAALEYAASRIERPRDLMEIVGATLEKQVQKRFRSKTDPTGAPWAPLSHKTLARKKGRGSMLQDSGHGLSNLEAHAGDDWTEVGFVDAYMGFHETGTRKMKRRGMLTADPVAGLLGAEDEVAVLADVDAFLSGLGLS